MNTRQVDCIHAIPAILRNIGKCEFYRLAKDWKMGKFMGACTTL
jgi:hypothetical protein